MPSPHAFSTKRLLAWDGDTEGNAKRLCKPLDAPTAAFHHVKCSASGRSDWKELSRGILGPGEEQWKRQSRPHANAGCHQQVASKEEVQIVEMATSGRPLTAQQMQDSAASMGAALAASMPKAEASKAAHETASPHMLKALPGAPTSRSHSSPLPAPGAAKAAQSSGRALWDDEYEWARMFGALSLGRSGSQRSDPIYAAAASSKQSPSPVVSSAVCADATQATLRRFFKPLPGAQLAAQNQPDNSAARRQVAVVNASTSHALQQGHSPIHGLQPSSSPIHGLEQGHSPIHRVEQGHSPIHDPMLCHSPIHGPVLGLQRRQSHDRPPVCTAGPEGDLSRIRTSEGGEQLREDSAPAPWLPANKSAGQLPAIRSPPNDMCIGSCSEATRHAAAAGKDIRSYFGAAAKIPAPKMCPICNQVVLGGPKEINAHIDVCLREMVDMDAT